MIPKIEDIPSILADRKLFERVVYTPIKQAIEELKNRKGDEELSRKTSVLFKNNLPKPLVSKPAAVLFRQLATPNYEVRLFGDLVDEIRGLDVLFFEYYSDKFTSNNEWKHSLGKLKFYHGKGKAGGMKIERINIIEFNDFVGKKISEVKTIWGQTLVNFHHEFFRKTYKVFSKKQFYDASKWFKSQGSSADKYYTSFLALFVKNGILFENFMLDTKEVSFTRDVFLPAFIEVFNRTGKKPLIVALEFTDTEGDEMWLCHPGKNDVVIKKKLKSKKISQSVKSFVKKFVSFD